MDIPFKTISEYELDDVILKAIAHIVLATMMVKVKPRKMRVPYKCGLREYKPCPIIAFIYRYWIEGRTCHLMASHHD
jgi:hypothetical protein